ncbi:MAG: SpvB/TcaC N-terminal domain-containing protein [Bacteroidota bacterium]|nr:SpvB/TcaC N-terminal domain-containing protein [Bacteroidota bacterium]
MRILRSLKLINPVNLFALFFFISVADSKAQNTNYTPLYTSSNFVKTIDLSKPVGTVNGAAGTTPSGGATYSIPVYTPPGTNGLEPSVNIAYNSQGGDGIAGFGWNIGGLSVITRTGKNIYHNGIVNPVTYTSDDAFLLDGMRLNAITGSNGANGTIYAGETETFAKIISNTSGSVNNPDWFQVTAKDGSGMEFGHTADSRILTDDGQNVLLWRINRIIDINGNYIDFKYNNSDRDSRIEQIVYTGNINTGLLPYNQINFSYTIRSDINTAYDGGASLSSKYLLDKITILTLDAAGIQYQTVKTYQFNYGFDNVHSLLKEVIEYGGDETGPSLNSTIFLYGDQPASLSYYTAGLLTGNYDLFPGDFNGDGRSDVLAAQIAYNYMGLKYYPSYSIFSDINNGSGGTLLYSYSTPGNNIIGGTPTKLYNFLSSDYNKDGRDDVLFLAADLVESGQSLFINSVVLNKTGSYNPQTGYTDYTTQYIPYPVSGAYAYQMTSSTGKSFIPGDFDGDGNQDYILIARNTSNQYKAFITSPATNELNMEIGNFGAGSNPYPDSYAQTILQGDKVVPIDFDGDGKVELLVTRGYKTYIVSFQRTSIATGYNFIASVIDSTNDVIQNYRIYPGDFNGDRKTDLLVHHDDNTWGIMYSDGKSYSGAYPFTFQQTVATSGLDVTDKIIVADFDGDGKSDILHGYNYYVGGVATSSRLSCYYSKGFSLSNSFYYEQYTFNDPLNMSADMISGDFNGDGRNDLINRFSSSADFIFIKPLGTERLLSKVTNGHNATTDFGYKLLTDQTYPYFYNRTISLDDPSNQNPYNYVQLPIYAVSALIVPDGIGGNNTTTFTYENAIVHRAAKGFLGFRKITETDAATGITSITENDINTQFAVPFTTRLTSYLTSTNQLLSESQITNSFTNLSTGVNDIRCLQKVDKTLSIDYLNGRASESVNTYDSYDNVTTNVTKAGVLSGNTVDPTETITTTTAYSIHNTPVPSKPDNFTVSNLRTGMPSVSVATSYTYTTNGLVASQSVFDGLPKAVSTSYTYNSFGNLLTAITSSAGLNSRTTTNTYDANGRFALSKQVSGNNVSQTTSTTYDSKWGSPVSTTSPDCLTTTFVYDEFGRLKTTNLPEGYSVNTSLIWDLQDNNVYYSFTDYPGGHPDVKTWHDKLDRETQTQRAGLFSYGWIAKTTTYNSRGEIATQTNSYYLETPLTTTNSYDDYGRLLSQSNALGTTQYAYSTLSGGKMQTTVTNPAGQVSSKIIDAGGKVVVAIDNGGELDFTYDSRGNQLEVKHSNTTLVTSVYDNYGRQSSLNDVNAGTVSYTYDAYGQLTQQVDAKGNTYNMLYDDLGRITSKTLVGEAPTTYEYYKDIATGCNNNSLSKITGPNGVVKQYTFDAMKRPATEKVTVDGTDYTTAYTYDQYGNLHKTTYPSGVEVVNTYEENGYFQEISNGEPVLGGPYLFLIGGINGSGQYTSYALGNHISTLKYYNYGIPTRIVSNRSSIQDLNFTFDYTTGNLLSRYDAIKNKTENFEYDNLNRLTKNYIQTTGRPVPQGIVNYDNNAGVSKGNIASKTDGGNYTYSSTKLHAVAYTLDDPNPFRPGGPWPVSAASHTEQIITYTSFLKTASITEGIYQLNFTYGPDQERIKSELKTNGVVTETRYYFGNYEKQIKNGVTREIHYVSDGNELIAILVKESGVTTPYFVYTDYLGSILTVTDANGSGVADRNFDAWGRSRDPRDWYTIYAPTATLTGPDWLYRGFTGHEMLPQFALINMNGRMYDPVIGRMLSPDNYVSDPFGTQGYNRYSYAMNNPLSYVDQDGNFPWLAIAIVSFLGGTAKGLNSIANKGNFFDGFWRGAVVSGVGAIIGAGLAGTFANMGMIGSGFVQGGIGGIIAGGINSELEGNDFFDGVWGNGLVGGLSEAVFGAINRASMGNVSDMLEDGQGLPGTDYFESQSELEDFANKYNGDMNSIEKEIHTDLQLGNEHNLPKDYIYGPVGHRIYKLGKKDVFTVDGVTQIKGGWFSKIESTIFISPHVKGVYFNGGNFGQMVINHEIMHAYHWVWSWGDAPSQSMYSERATSMYSLAYAKAYDMPLFQSYYRPNLGYYPDWYSWRKNPWFAQHLKLGIQ